MATKANLLIDQGSDFSTTITITDDEGLPVDLSEYTGAAQMRKHYTSAISYNFNVAVGSGDGTVTLSMTYAQTANIASGRYVYDCELLSSANVTSRILEGIVTVTPEVTR
jgi:hypothetical protein